MKALLSLLKNFTLVWAGITCFASTLFLLVWGAVRTFQYISTLPDYLSFPLNVVFFTFILALFFTFLFKCSDGLQE